MARIPKKLEGVDRIFFILGEPNRRKMIELMIEEPRRPSQFARILGMSLACVNIHLRQMMEAGLVVRRQNHAAKWSIYWVGSDLVNAQLNGMFNVAEYVDQEINLNAKETEGGRAMIKTKFNGETSGPCAFGGSRPPRPTIKQRKDRKP